MKRLGGIAFMGSIILVTTLLVTCGKEVSPAPSLTAEQIIDNSSRAMEEINSFRFELIHEGGGTPIVMGLEMTKAVGEMARPDKLRTTVWATRDNNSLKLEVVTIAEVTYMRMTYPLELRWEPLSSEFSAVGLFDPNAGVTAIIKGLADFSKLDDERVSGVACYKLKGSIDSGALRPIFGSSVVQGIAITTEVWIGREDFLMRQVKFDGQITENEASGIIRTLKLSDFNQPLTIELPQ